MLKVLCVTFLALLGATGAYAQSTAGKITAQDEWQILFCDTCVTDFEFKSLVANRKQGNILIYNLENKSVRSYQARYGNGKRSLVVNQVDVPQDAIDVLNELYLLQEAFERVEKSNW